MRDTSRYDITLQSYNVLTVLSLPPFLLIFLSSNSNSWPLTTIQNKIFLPSDLWGIGVGDHFQTVIKFDINIK